MKKLFITTLSMIAIIGLSGSSFAEEGGRAGVSHGERGTATKEMRSNKGGELKGAERAAKAKIDRPEKVGKPVAEPAVAPAVQ